MTIVGRMVVLCRPVELRMVSFLTVQKLMPTLAAFDVIGKIDSVDLLLPCFTVLLPYFAVERDVVLLQNLGCWR
jgi:hypothetical protein